MYTLSIIAVLAFAFSVFSAIVSIFIAEKIGLVDSPGGRKIHKKNTPLAGGFIIYAGCMAVPFIKIDMVSWKILVLMLITLGIGLIDDIFEISAILRLFLQFLIGLGMALSLNQPLTSLGDFLGVGSVTLGIFSIPFICFSVAAAKNAINMIDGIDGLAGVLTLIPVVAIFFLAMRANILNLAGFSIAIAVSLFVFLILNFPAQRRANAACFLGDSGSTLLGFLVAYLLVSTTTTGIIRPVVTLYLFAIPLIDSACVFFRRIKRGLAIHYPGRDHWHHQMVDGGLSVRQTTLFMGSVAVIIASAGIIMEQRGVSESTMFYFFIVLMCLQFLNLASGSTLVKFLIRFTQGLLTKE